MTRHSESGVGGNSRIGTNLPKSTSSPAIVTMRIENSEEFVVAGGEGNGNVHRNGNGNGDQRTLSPNGGQNALCPGTGTSEAACHKNYCNSSLKCRPKLEPFTEMADWSDRNGGLGCSVASFPASSLSFFSHVQFHQNVLTWAESLGPKRDPHMTTLATTN